MPTSPEKIERELFVGNVPHGTSDLLLLHFVSAAMRRVRMCEAQDNPVVSSRIGNKFAFVELATPELADKALNLNGIPFIGGVLLKISRPSKYSGPLLHGSQTWQQLTGQSAPDSALLDSEQEKLRRELFIGNTTPEMADHMIRKFLGDAMEQVGLTTSPGNPITACRVSGKFAFIELRSAIEAKNALNLNNIPFMGASLRVGRPSKYTGPPDNHGNWEDILAKFMAGELQVAGSSGPLSSSSSQAQPLSRVVQITNMLTRADLENDSDYNEILEDTREECGQFGQLVSTVIPRANEPGATKVYLEYSSTNDAQSAIDSLQGRTFDGRQVQATFFDESRFSARDFS